MAETKKTNNITDKQLKPGEKFRVKYNLETGDIFEHNPSPRAVKDDRKGVVIEMHRLTTKKMPGGGVEPVNYIEAKIKNFGWWTIAQPGDEATFQGVPTGGEYNAVGYTLPGECRSIKEAIEKSTMWIDHQKEQNDQRPAG